MAASELVFKTVRELGVLLRDRQVSPVELVELSLSRLDTVGRELNAVVTLTADRAMAQARTAEAEIAAGRYRGPLHGIPYGAKDLLATSGGIPTTWGAAPFRDQTFDHDATVIRKLEEAGAVLCAKLAMVELAGGMGYRQPKASFTGAGINPWNREHWTGGSSSGSASAVAAGLVPFAIGTETWGSIMGPSCNCGLSGLRPTYGRVSRRGAMALCWTLDKIGPLARTADDCGLVVEAIAGLDPDDPTSADRPYVYEGGAPKRRFRVGVIRDVAANADPQVSANFEAAIGVLGEVADVEELVLPDLPYRAVTQTILQVEATSAFEDFLRAGRASELTAPEVVYQPLARFAIPATDYLRALRLRGVIARQIGELMSGLDALAAPTRPVLAPSIEGDFTPAQSGDDMGAIGNGAGLPSVSVPNGFGGARLPTGIQLMGNAYDENGVLALANAYQSLTDWHTRHPADLV
jgi:aspartyl-tRNA(Asn)/glutamyl-tRNA(Gln) amidotransferase subunit A